MKNGRYLIIIGLLFSVLSGYSQYNQGVLVQKVLQTDTSYIGQKIIFPGGSNNEVTIARITFKPGESTGWHKHGFPVFAYVLQGTLTVEIEGRKSVIFFQNSSFSEVIDTLHNGTNSGKDDLILIAFYLGEKGKPLSESFKKE